jgi:hypothetical protein
VSETPEQPQPQPQADQAGAAADVPSAPDVADVPSAPVVPATPAAPPAPAGPQAGWYPDPSGSPVLRWWDGAAWTDHTHAVPQAAPAPAMAGAPAYAAPAYGSPAPVATVPAYGSPVPFPTAEQQAAADASERTAKKRAGAIVLVALLLIIALAAGTALVGSLTGPRLNTANVEKQIADDVANAAGASTVVRCPDRVDLVAGSTFECEIDISDGRTATAVVTLTDDKGGVTYKLQAANA